MTHTAHPLVARIERALAGRAPQLAERDEPFKEAAVALIIRPCVNDDAELLFIRRSLRAGDPWSGQIGLPGGRFEPADASLEETALRETFEEVGLDLRAEGRVLGMLDEIRPRTPVLPPIIVRPFVAVVSPDVAFVPNREVAGTFWVPLSHLRAVEAQVEYAMDVNGVRAVFPAYAVNGHVVWGLTERIVRQLLTVFDD